MIRGTEYSTPDDIAIRDTLQRTFSSDHGRVALQLLLRWSGFFDVAIDRQTMSQSEAIARRNFMVEVLERMGIFHDENVEELVKHMMLVEPKPMRGTSAGDEKL